MQTDKCLLVAEEARAHETAIEAARRRAMQNEKQHGLHGLHHDAQQHQSKRPVFLVFTQYGQLGKLVEEVKIVTAGLLSLKVQTNTLLNLRLAGTSKRFVSSLQSFNFYDFMTHFTSGQKRNTKLPQLEIQSCHNCICISMNGSMIGVVSIDIVRRCSTKSLQRPPSPPSLTAGVVPAPKQCACV